MAEGTDLLSPMMKCSEYFDQISSLMCEVDGRLADSGFPVPNPFTNTAFYGKGASPDKPAKWGPRYFIRVYARPDWNDLKNHGFWGFF